MGATVTEPKITMSPRILTTVWNLSLSISPRKLGNLLSRRFETIPPEPSAQGW
jgi:hypothetical protein